MSFLQLVLVIILAVSLLLEGGAKKNNPRLQILITKTENHEDHEDRYIYKYDLNTIHSQIESSILN